MEWVETTGKTVEEAKEAALDQLGVDEEEAEFEIIEEPKSGLFGRVRREARVRARIQPKKPRPKADRRERRRKGPKDGDRPSGAKNGKPNGNRGGGNKSRAAGGTKSEPAKAATDAKKGDANKGDASTKPRERRPKPEPAVSAEATASAVGVTTATADPAGNQPDRKPRDDRDARSRNGEQQAEGEQVSSETVSMDEQAAIIEEFLEGLMDAFSVDTDLRREEVDDELLEVQVDAPDLGLLIGPKGQTLSAIQELSRTVLQRKATGVYEGRVRIDIGGYRNRRRAALERFATGVAEQVRGSGKQKVLEPMNPADRKVVHDTINDIDGVETSSEGTEPYRRVVIRPAD